MVTLDRVVLGRTGLQVSKLALGTVALGLEYGIPQPGKTLKPDRASAARLLDRALDLGVTLIDTARAYGESEEIIGEAIGARRKEFVLATKVTASPGEPQRVRESIETSLRALRTDVLDIVQIHCKPQDQVPDPATTEALLACKQQGLIRYLGVSVYGDAVAMDAMRQGHCDVVQVAYNALDRRVRTQLLPAAAQCECGVLVRSVLLKGALTSRHANLDESLHPLKEQARRLEAMALRGGISLPELAYRYVWSDARTLCVLSGAASIPELELAMEWASRGPLPPEWIQEIEAMEMLDEQQLSPAHWRQK